MSTYVKVGAHRSPHAASPATEQRAAKARERARARKHERERLRGQPHPIPLCRCDPALFGHVRCPRHEAREPLPCEVQRTEWDLARPNVTDPGVP